MDDFGANSAQRAGEGDAYILKWEPLYRTVNAIQQRNLYHQQLYQKDLLKSQLELKDIAKTIRPVDMPKFKKMSDSFLQASMIAEDRKIQRDPVKLAEALKVKQEAFYNAMSIGEQSKRAVANKAEWIKGMFAKQGVGFVNPVDARPLWEEYDNTPADELQNKGFDNPTRFMLPPERMPKNLFEEEIKGKRIEKDIDVPVYDKDGKTVKAWEKRKSIYYENSDKPEIIALNTATIAKLSPDMADLFEEQYQVASANPAMVGKIFEQAESMAKAPLPKDAYGFAAAKKIVEAQKTISPDVISVEEDPAYVRNVRRTQAMADYQKRMALQEGKEKRVAMFKKSIKADGDEDEENYEIDAEALYEASLSGDHDTVDAIGAAATKDSGGKLVAVSKANILSPDKNRKIIEDFGLDIPAVSDNRAKEVVQMVKGGGTEQFKDQYVNTVLDAIKRKTGVTIKPEDISKSIVPVVVREEIKGNLDKATGEYTGSSKAVIKAKAYNPNLKTKEQFGSDFSTERIKIPKWKIEQQKKKPNMVQRAVNTIKKKAKDYGL